MWPVRGSPGSVDQVDSGVSSTGVGMARNSTEVGNTDKGVKI